MKTKKGFTLIELLAVIVILAIIALIATPVIMNIIKTSRENSAIESAKLYIKSLQAVVTQKKLEDHNYNLTTCTEPTCGGFTIVTDDTMPESVNLMFEKEKLQANSTMKIMGYNLVYDGRKWVIKDEIADACKGYERVLAYDILPTCEAAVTEMFDESAVAVCTGGTYYGYDMQGVINLGYKEGLIEAGAISNVRYEQGECIAPKIFNKTTNETKTLGTIPTGQFNPGDEYIIGPGDGWGYHFYVLSDNGDGTVNLISLEILAKTAWISKVDYNDDVNYGGNGNNNKGPITAMNALYTATQNWTNIPNITINYRDENIDSTTLQEGDYTTGYDGIYTTGNTTIIKAHDGTTTATYTNLKARMITMAETLNLGCTLEEGSCPSWLYNSATAYMSMTTLANDICDIWDIEYSGKMYDRRSDASVAVIPVITVPKSSLQ